MSQNGSNFSDDSTLSQASSSQKLANTQGYSHLTQTTNGIRTNNNEQTHLSLKNQMDIISLESITNILGDLRELRATVHQQKRLHTELNTASEYGHSLKSKLQQLEKQLDENESIKLTFKQKVSQCESETKATNQKLEKLELKCAQANSENTILNTKIERMLLEQNELRSQAVVASIERDKAQAELKLVRAEFDNKSQENLKLGQALKASEEALKRSQELINNIGLTEVTEQILKETSNDKDPFKSLQAGFDAEKQNIYEFLRVIMKELVDKEKELREIREAKIKEAVLSLEADNVKLKQQVEAYSTTIQDQTKQMSELKNQIFQSKAEREDLQKIIAQKNLEHQEIQKLRDELKRKKTLISELQALVKVLEAHYSQLEGAKMKEVEDETQFNDKKYEDLLSQYSIIKEDWIRLMKEHNALKESIQGLSDKDSQNYVNNLIQTNKDLSDQYKKMQAEAQRIYEDALAKINRIKKYTREVLGWEISISQEIIELKSVVGQADGKDSTIVIRINEEGSYDILETEFSQELFDKNPNLSLLIKKSYPLLFSYINVMMRPDLSDLYYVST